MRAHRSLVAMLILTLLSAGAAAAGQISHHAFPSEILDRDYAYNIYLPSDYADSGFSYPVVYLLHGSFGSEHDWVGKGRLRRIADRMIRNGDIPPTIFVMPGSQSWWVDGYNEEARTAFFEELIPHVDATWRTIAEREGRAIGGLSAGGYGTVNFVLEYPHMFAAAAALSPASYEPLPPQLSSSHRHPAFMTPEGNFDPELWLRLNYPEYLDDYKAQEYVVPMYISSGDRDILDIERHASALYRRLQAHQPDRVAFELFRGGHQWRVWRASLPPALRFMATYTSLPRKELAAD
ncbi:alpha/beta hydrolase [Litchfieldella rifensis]|uniref:Alpha/beta hydrolase n=1 Tax=Litchfieldella rifensis TaxID=762643 RepID=A0ABV7LUA7_9GAMM